MDIRLEFSKLYRWAGIPVVVGLGFLALMSWGSRVPARPSGISPRGIFIERGSVPFKLSVQGNWLDCWQDEGTKADHCRLTDEIGKLKFEDTFLPYDGKPLIPAADLRIDPSKTGHLWIGATPANVSLPIVFLENSAILLRASEYSKAKRVVDFWVSGHSND
jgi:hypothetical protein